MFLLLYNKKCVNLFSTLDEDDVLKMTKTEFNEYCGSPEYHNDLSTGLSPSTKTTASTNALTNELTASDFRRGVKCNKSRNM